MPLLRFPVMFNRWRPKPVAPAAKCGLTVEAAEFVALWLTHPLQQRQGARCDERLVRAAQRHAEWLHAQREAGAWVGGFPDLHIGEHGSTANERVRAQGYRLPDWYPAQGNQVESISIRNAAVVGVDGILAALLASPGHAHHITGDLDFFRAQTVLGVGHIPPVVWVVVSAPPEG